MKKLTLDMDTLRVESFTTQDAASGRGTVRGYDDTMETEHCTRVQTCLITTCVTLKTCRCNEAEDFGEGE